MRKAGIIIVRRTWRAIKVLLAFNFAQINEIEAKLSSKLFCRFYDFFWDFHVANIDNYLDCEYV